MPTQKPSTKFANALLFSLALHLAVWIAFLIWGEPFSARPLTKTTITFVTLTPRLGSPQAPVNGNAEPSTGEPGPAAPTPVQPASPENPKSEAPLPKKVEAPPKKNDPLPPKKSNTPNLKSTPKSNPPKKDSKTVKSTATSKKTNTDRAPVKKTSASAPANSASNSQKTESSAADQKMASALANIQKDLNQRGGTGTSSSGGTGGGGGAGSGNAGTPGAAGGDPNSPEYKGYQSSVKSKVTSKWFRPSNPDGVKRRTVVKVRIDGSGNVTSKSIRKSSGDASFDNSVLRAIEQASPFPMPPSSVRDEAVNDGFVIEMVGR